MHLRKLLENGTARGPELFTVKKSEHPNLYGRISEVRFWLRQNDSGAVFKATKKGEVLGGELNGDCEKKDDHECGANRSRFLRTRISSAG